MNKDYQYYKNELLRRKKAEATRLQAIQFYTQFSLTTYVSLLNDYAITLIDRLHEHYKSTKTYENNAQFRTLLDKVKTFSETTYSFMNKSVKDMQFYTDLRDGATDYLDKELTPLFAELRSVYKASHVRNDKFVSACTSAFVIIQSAQYRIDEILETLRSSGATCKGVTPYMMVGEKDCLMKLHDLMGRDYDPKFDKTFQGTLLKIGNILSPDRLVKEAGNEALRYASPKAQDNFTQHCKTLYNIDF